MSDQVLYQIHLRRLGEIKQRQNKYPVYNIEKKLKNPSPKKQKIDELVSQIKTNKTNITSIKKGFDKKKPVNYDEDDKYIYDREVEKIQKAMMNQLINNNKNLKNELKNLQKNKYHPKLKKSK